MYIITMYVYEPTCGCSSVNFQKGTFNTVASWLAHSTNKVISIIIETKVVLECYILPNIANYLTINMPWKFGCNNRATAL